MTAEKKLNTELKNGKKLDLGEFMDLVHDVANTLYGGDVGIMTSMAVSYTHLRAHETVY